MKLIIDLRGTAIYKDKNFQFNIDKIQKVIDYFNKIINKNEEMI